MRDNPERDEETIAQTAIDWSKTLGDLRNKTKDGKFAFKKNEKDKNNKFKVVGTETKELRAVKLTDEQKIIQQKSEELKKTSPITEALVNHDLNQTGPLTAEKIKNFISKANRCKPDYEKDQNSLAARMAEIANKEKDHLDKMVFYHGTMSNIGFLYDVVREFRALLENSDPSGLWIRAFDDKLSKEKNIYEVITNYLRDQNKDFKEFHDHDECARNKLLSVNLSLVGNSTRGGECTYDYFYQDKSVKKDYENLFITNFLINIGLIKSTKKYDEIYEKYIANKSGQSNGYLLQIFLDPNDDLGYLCKIIGRGYFEYKPQTQDDALKLKNEFKNKKIMLSDIILQLRKDPKAFEEKYSGDSGSIKLNIDMIQARLFTHPAIFKNANINTYWFNKINENEYKKALKAQVEKDLKLFLTEKIATDENAFLTSKAVENQGNKRPHIQQGHKIIYEQNYGKDSYVAKERNFALENIFNKIIVNEAITNDDFKIIEANKEYIKKQLLVFDETKKIKIISSICIFMIEHNKDYKQFIDEFSYIGIERIGESIFIEKIGKSLFKYMINNDKDYKSFFNEINNIKTLLIDEEIIKDTLEISGLKNIQNIDLKGYKGKKIEIKDLENLISISINNTESNIILKNLPKLRIFTFSDNKADELKLENLPEINFISISKSELKTLNLENSKNIEMMILDNLINLKEVYFDNTDNNELKLFNLPKLESIGFRLKQISIPSVKKFFL